MKLAPTEIVDDYLEEIHDGIYTKIAVGENGYTGSFDDWLFSTWIPNRSSSLASTIGGSESNPVGLDGVLLSQMLKELKEYWILASLAWDYNHEEL